MGGITIGENGSQYGMHALFINAINRASSKRMHSTSVFSIIYYILKA
jgi:hypothetical protein